jgi:aryl-alcohol dehydrogenase-like predicted oxidoreductase
MSYKMDYVTLGRTGLNVSVIGLGGGGSSRLGMNTHKNELESTVLVRKAIEMGINFIDTAEVYGTEPQIGEALQSMNRDQVYLSSKYSLRNGEQFKKPEDLEKSLDRSLFNLRTEYIDIYHLHGVSLKDYDFCVEYLVPELIRMREKGKIRFLGITEGFASDPGHHMLEKAVMDDYWDVMMVGFNILNQSASTTLLPATIAKNIGILAMFAVRRALSDPVALVELIHDMIDRGLLDGRMIDKLNPLGFLVHEGGAQSLTDAAYRFCRHEPGIHCMLSGTGNIHHLLDNIQSANRRPLPDNDLQQIRELFAGIDSVSGN